MMSRVLISLLLLATACGSKSLPSVVPPDAGMPVVDAGSLDAGSSDAGSVAGPIAIARSQIPSSIALTPTQAVWGNQSDPSVLSAPVAGGGPITEITRGGADVNAVLVAEGATYWARNDGTLGGVAADGTKLPDVSGMQSPQAMLVVAGKLYVTDLSAGTVWVLPMPPAGASPTAFATKLTGAVSLATDGLALYVTTWGSDPPPNGGGAKHDGSVMKIGLADGMVTRIASNLGRPTGLVVSSGALYFTAFDDNTISKLDPATSQLTVILKDRAAPYALAADAQRLWWTEQGLTTDNVGGVYSMPIAGGSVATVAAERVQPVAIAVDDTRVYWAEVGNADVREGGIWAALK
jgi:hypothetical protein